MYLYNIYTINKIRIKRLSFLDVIKNDNKKIIKLAIQSEQLSLICNKEIILEEVSTIKAFEIIDEVKKEDLFISSQENISFIRIYAHEVEQKKEIVTEIQVKPSIFEFFKNNDFYIKRTPSYTFSSNKLFKSQPSSLIYNSIIKPLNQIQSELNIITINRISKPKNSIESNLNNITIIEHIEKRFTELIKDSQSLSLLSLPKESIKEIVKVVTKYEYISNKKSEFESKIQSLNREIAELKKKLSKILLLIMVRKETIRLLN